MCSLLPSRTSTQFVFSDSRWNPRKAPLPALLLGACTYVERRHALAVYRANHESLALRGDFLTSDSVLGEPFARSANSIALRCLNCLASRSGDGGASITTCSYTVPTASLFDVAIDWRPIVWKAVLPQPRRRVRVVSRSSSSIS